MTTPSAVDVFAPAKVNLALHVVGQRDDGYHLLDTLVVFADVGDRIRLEARGPREIAVTGPEADPALAGPGNIMWQVAERFWPEDTPLSMSLEKVLPVASGIGGGSADAAACFRGVMALKGVDGPIQADHMDALTALGADIPMCVGSVTARVQGIGERIFPIADLPALGCVLVNPRMQLSTPTIFKALGTKDNPGMDEPPAAPNQTEFLSWLAAQRNDLQAPAVAQAPVIADVLAALTGLDGCRFARMSGSGATCFGLFADRAAAEVAAKALEVAYPDWWVQAGMLNA